MRLFDLSNQHLDGMTRSQIESMAMVQVIFELGGEHVKELLAKLNCYSLIVKRYNAIYNGCDCVADQYTLAVVSSLCKDFKEISMWGYQLAWMAKEKGSPLEIEDLFVSGPFFNGLPTKKAFDICWEQQKVKAHPEDSSSYDGMFDKENYPILP